MNERPDDLRRELAREAQDHDAKEAIKGLRWLLLHRRDNLEKDAARRLKRSLALNEPLHGGIRLDPAGEKTSRRSVPGQDVLGDREFLAEMNQHGIVRPQSVDSPESTQSTTYGPSGY